MPALPVHSYRIASASSARLVNCYPEVLPQDAKAPFAIRRSPGITPFASSQAGVGRGLAVLSGQLYAVCGASVCGINSSGAMQAIGTIAGSNPVFWAANDTQLVIVADGSGYVISGGAVAPITDDDFPKAGACAFLDGYIVFVEPYTGRFFASDLRDVSSYDGLNFATAEGAPDGLISLAVDHRQIVLIGSQSTELWDNVGQAGFPFARAGNGFMELGGAAAHGVTKQDQSVYMLASDRTIRRLQGVTWNRVSQHGVEDAIKGYARVDDCIAYAYTISGHLCTVWNFPNANATWIYDATTNEWHERESFPNFGMWDVSGIVECYGKTFVQRASDGAVGILSATEYSEWGAALRYSWTYQGLYGSGNRVYTGRLELGIETGVGLVTGQGSDPRLTLEISRDGGRTFPITMPTRSFGAVGQYRTRVHWDRLGGGFDNVYRISGSDPVPLTVWDTVIR